MWTKLAPESDAFKVKKTELLALHPSVHPSALFCSYMYLLDPLVFSTLLLFVPWILVLTNHPTLMVCSFDKGKYILCGNSYFPLLVLWMCHFPPAVIQILSTIMFLWMYYLSYFTLGGILYTCHALMLLVPQSLCSSHKAGHLFLLLFNGSLQELLY